MIADYGVMLFNGCCGLVPHDLRDDAQRVMLKNYPQSDFLARGFKRPGEDDPWWKLW